ncbi:MAG: hypothetical protein A2Y66_06885 [Nitrospirae bacterium RBG_13_41_22]|nr:MAG: hypothetical protein A2Y66_06885 [Nitrospirae bacterium RBG_13_41_22]
MDKERSIFRSRAFLNAIYNGIVAIDEAGLIVYFNETASRIFNITLDKALKRPIMEVLPNTGGKLLECLSTKEVLVGYRLQGERVSLITNINPVFEGDKVIGVISVFQEVSEIEKIAKELESYKSINNQMDAIFVSSYDGLFICDGNGIILKCNKSSERLIGHKNEDIVGRHVGDLVKMGYIDRSVTLEVIRKRAAVTILQKLRNGRQIIVTGTPVFDSHGRIEFIVTNERDITALNKMKSELREYQLCAARKKMVCGQDICLPDIIAEDEKTKQVFQTAQIAAGFDTIVLIEGETGVGKGLMARFIHQTSRRRKAPFFKINCGAIPTSLMESELFGYKKGAFTGADPQGKIGLLRMAEGGTLFLDEIGEMNSDMQVKLLKVIEDKELMPVGATKAIKVDIRIIAATNQDLAKLLSDGRFRKDLYYRLNVVQIKIPPLRERRGDIFPLISHFLSKMNRRFNCVKNIATEAVDLLCAYSYPGNIRELENIIERLVVLTSQNEILPEHLPMHVTAENMLSASFADNENGLTLKQMLRAYERQIIQSAMLKYGSKTMAARALGVNQSTIFRKRKKTLRNAIMH